MFVCSCQEWLASSCVLLGSPCVWLELLNRSCIHRRSVRATWNPCRGSTASDARPRKSTSAKVSMCVCLSSHWFSVGLFFADLRLCVNRATTESDKIPLTLQHLNHVTIDLFNVMLIDLFLCLCSYTNQVYWKSRQQVWVHALKVTQVKTLWDINTEDLCSEDCIWQILSLTSFNVKRIYK